MTPSDVVAGRVREIRHKRAMTVAQLADRLADLARDPELRKRFGAAGRSRVLPRYAVDRLVDDVDRLYRSLLSAHDIRACS